MPAHTGQMAEQHSADNQHVKRQALPPRRGNAYYLSCWHSGSYASGFYPGILSHTLEATSSITERQRRICYRSFTPLRSVQDDRRGDFVQNAVSVLNKMGALSVHP